MRVACEVNYLELNGDYGPVESVCACCSRCGHETESYGTSDASIRRCLALLRDECPRSERNYYYEGEPAEERQSPVAAAYERGYAEGYATAARTRRDHAVPLDAELLRECVHLCHPDRHPVERFAQANRATSRLLALLDQERRAA